MMVKIV